PKPETVEPRKPEAVSPRAAPVASPSAAEPALAAPRTAPNRRGAARFLVPAAALIVVATGVGVVATHPQLVRFGRGAVAERPGAAGLASPSPSSPPTADATSPSDADPADLLDRAAARSADAQRVRTPEAYDGAANAWQAAIPVLQNDPEELAAGHREIAAARFAAWNAAPTPARHDAAMMAVRAYLLCAPPGEDRDRAWTWLARLKR
ncbi:MAG: hypothetical protein ACM3PF_05375, partial [Bacteroidota bacterium]